ncbi:Sucrase/ferredoxin-like-domain-containing protein [Melampsora americana]|nr:Sucrase/ferredoxin-like-domain-containing protein [Melampsora americana]
MSSFLNGLFANRAIPSSSSSSTTNTSIESPSTKESRVSRHFPSSEIITSLKQVGIPVSTISDADCATCAEACSGPMNMEGYPSSFSIDTTTPLLGAIKDFDYLILCSSGKTDWPHDVCADLHSVPGALRQAYPKPSPSTKPQRKTSIAGVLPLSSPCTAPTTSEENACGGQLTVAIFSSSHFSLSDNDDTHSLIILPNWVLMPDVTPSNLPNLPLPMDLFPRLPHQLIILLCSHKTRDKRCAIAAPILKDALVDVFESLEPAWQVDSRGDEAAHSSEEPLVGIFNISHSGGHKFAGNMILNFPNGASVWYGRVMPSDCERIVKETVLNHRVVPELLKGGFGLGTLKCNALLAW